MKSNRLPVSTVPAGTRWYRIYLAARDPLWFGPKLGSPPVMRFDDPLSEFRVCYFGSSLQACFAETFLRNPPVRILTIRDLAARSLATFEVRRPVRLVRLYGPALARVGVTAEIAMGADYEQSQIWSRRIWNHTERPDGIAYHSRHDDSTICIGLFDRASKSIAVTAGMPLLRDEQAISQLLKRYSLGLTR